MEETIGMLRIIRRREEGGGEKESSGKRSEQEGPKDQRLRKRGKRLIER